MKLSSDLNARRRAVTMLVSLIGHLLVGLALVALVPAPPPTPPPPTMQVAIVDLSPTVTAATSLAPSPAAGQSAPRRPASLGAGHAQRMAHTTTAADLSAGAGDSLDIGDLADSSDADAGPSAKACDMPRRLQNALRSDPLVQAAVAASAGKAILVWNGDWIQSGGEDGKGLAAVREAIVWEVAFAPPACRAEPVHGVILLALNQTPRSVRLAVGTRAWRWSDLLNSTSSGSHRFDR